MPKYTSVDEYLAAFPHEVRPILDRVRAIVLEVAPDAEERIAYDMPAYSLDGKRFVHFAGWKKWVAIYPVYVGDAEYEEAIRHYRAAKDAVHFRYTAPLPEPVVRRIVAMLRDRALGPL